MEYHEYHQHIVEASPSINVEAEPELFSTIWGGVFASSQMKSQMTGEIFTNPPSQATFSSIFQAWYVRICFDISIETYRNYVQLIHQPAKESVCISFQPENYLIDITRHLLTPPMSTVALQISGVFFHSWRADSGALSRLQRFPCQGHGWWPHEHLCLPEAWTGNDGNGNSQQLYSDYSHHRSSQSCLDHQDALQREIASGCKAIDLYWQRRSAHRAPMPAGFAMTLVCFQ